MGDDALALDIDAMLAYVREYLARGGAYGNEKGGAWRQTGSVRFEHIRRVLATAQNIARAEHADLDVVTVAAVFHDVAKLEVDQETHAVRGAEIAAEYLCNEGFSAEWVRRVCAVIATHNCVNASFPLEDRVLRDADLLDETGAMGIVWSSINSGRSENPSYADARARIVQHDWRYAESLEQRMLTRAGRDIAEQRRMFVESFIAELEDELGF